VAQTVTMSKLIYWNPMVVRGPVAEARDIAFAQVLGRAKALAPKGAGATMIPARHNPTRTTMFLKVTGWGSILAPGAKPHVITASGAFGGGGVTPYTKGSRVRYRKSTGSGAKALASKGFGPVEDVHHPGIKPHPYLEPAAALYPTYFSQALGTRLGRTFLGGRTGGFSGPRLSKAVDA